MGTDIVDVVEKLGGSFSLQLDESTDVSGNAQLIAFVRYIDTDDICEHVLFCKSLEGNTTGENIFNINVNSFFCKNGLNWKSCTSVCTDVASSMTGRVKGLMARIPNENPEVQWTHCVREALASKKISPVLHGVLNDSIKVINLLSQGNLMPPLWNHGNWTHTAAITYRSAQALSWKNTQQAVGITEVRTFLSEHRSTHATMFEDTDWLAKLCYLADVFSKMNVLNVCLQGKDTSILNLYDKVGGFLKKAELWK